MKRITIAVVAFFLAVPYAFAATLTLNSGKVVEGEIVERTEDYIRIDTGIGIPLTYYLDEIASVDSDEQNADGDELAAPSSEPVETDAVEPVAGQSDELVVVDEVELSDQVAPVVEELVASPSDEPATEVETDIETIEPSDSGEKDELVESVEPVEQVDQVESDLDGGQTSVPVIATERKPVETVILEPVAISTITKPAEEPLQEELATLPVESSDDPEETPEEPKPEAAQPQEDADEPEIVKLPVKIVEPEVSVPRKDIASLDGVEVFKPQTSSPVARKPGEAQPRIVTVEPEQKDPTGKVSPIEQEIARAKAVDQPESTNYWKVFLGKLDRLRESSAERLSQIKERIQKKWPDIQEKLLKIPVDVRRAILIVGLATLGGTYFLVCLPLMFIAHKLGHKHIYLIWLPVVQVFYYIRMAGRRMWAVLWLLIPVVQVFMPFVWFTGILKRLGKPRWLVMFMLLPVVSVFMLWFLAISKVNSSQDNSK